METPDLKTIQNYMENITVNGDLISFRDKDYAPNSPSLSEGRFNCNGQSAFYAASGELCAAAEVPNRDDRECYNIKVGTNIYAFNSIRYSKDHGNPNLFTISKEDGGYSITQDFAKYLTETASVSAILYKSHQLEKNGQFGVNLVVLPIDNNELVSDFFEKKI